MVTINASTTAGLVMTSDLSGGVNIQSNGTTVATIAPTTLTTTLNSASAQAPLITQIAGTEVARIDSNGRLLLGISTSIGASVAQIYSADLTNTNTGLYIKNGAATTGGYFIGFVNSSGTTIGNISQLTSTTVAYTTSSDYRLKNNIAPMTGALDVVSKLKPVTYTWKEDGSNGQGFIAHELQEIVPECVVGKKDDVDVDGKPKYQGIDTSFLVATLVSAIQELKAEVNMLKSKVGA